jgi:hypothetical protein
MRRKPDDLALAVYYVRQPQAHTHHMYNQQIWKTGACNVTDLVSVATV